MKKFLAGLLIGLLLATTTFAVANPALRLIVNGVDITSEAQPIIIDGRTLVPARALAEQLGATVEWDAANSAVVVTSPSQETKGSAITKEETLNISDLISGKEYANLSQLNDELIGLREISNLPGITGSFGPDGNYITDGEIKIFMEFNHGSDIINLAILKEQEILEHSQAKIINYRTYFPKSLLLKYGFLQE
ncbi:copper amine oxidase N-terminal domain-containing protein [Desulfitibacter alkalitolerans]|uniref:copper amine oxidase N-terminal domain-containing protein n=1 Tax=Desulfitibacter alkalitolerans TaxID=264641 RepID=UPI000683E7BD|nr:copper amine oxidase N-terminal domain-containing protein [Desulfitibacter alkalitolerans]